jgi:hypothetical protein
MPQPAGENAQKGDRNPLTKIFREFQGVNTKNDRTAIPAESFFDLVNLMPIGSANLHSIPNLSASLATFSTTIYRFQYANINNIDYLICFGIDGSVVAYNIVTSAKTTVAAAGTLSGSASKMDQWKNQAILVVDTNGYFSWNGTTWTQITGGILPGTYVNPDIAVFNGYVWIVSNRFLYVSNPNQYGQSAGTPRSTTANFLSGSTTINVVDPTTLQSALGNVIVGSTVTGAGIPAGTTVSTIDYTTGVITLNNATTAKAPTETAATTASFNAGDGQMTVGSATGIKIGSLIYSTAAGAGLPAGVAVSPGYVVGNTFVPMTITATANHVAGSVYYFTYPVTLTFSTSDSGWDLSGGAVVQYLTDPQYRGQVTRLLSANGYLYLFSKSSIFVISDVYVPQGQASPVFSIVNVQALIGSDQQMSVFALDRRLYFANPYGLWALQGVTAQRISEQIDGTMQYVDPSFAISGGTTQVWNIAQATFLIKQLNDPVFGTRVVLACFFDGKWWFYQPPTNCTFVGSGMAGTNTNVPSLFALINNQLYRLFSDYTTSPAASWKTALWSMDNSLADKEVFRAGFEVSAPNGIGSSFTLTLDTPTQSTSLNPTTGTQNIGWVNNLSNTVLWTNNSLATVFWYSATYALYFADGLGGYGKYVGMTFSSTAGATFSLTSVSMDFTFRKRW